MGLAAKWLGRVAGAWAALRGDGDAPATGAGAVQKRGAKSIQGMSPAKWARQAKEWERSRSMPGPSDRSFAEGMELVSALAAMPLKAKEALVLKDDEKIFGFGRSWREAAKTACDRPSMERALQDVRLHLAWCEASGEAVDPRALEDSASCVSRASWWEAAQEWGDGLCRLARGQSESGALSLGDEDCFSMCDTAALVGAKALLGAVSSGKGTIDERALAAWRLCCHWPWPCRAVDEETVEWARRKWRESYFGAEPGRLDAAFAKLGGEATWGELALARLESGYESAGIGDGSEALAAMAAMFRAERERDALGGAALKSSEGDGKGRCRL